MPSTRLHSPGTAPLAGSRNEAAAAYYSCVEDARSRQGRAPRIAGRCELRKNLWSPKGIAFGAFTAVRSTDNVRDRGRHEAAIFRNNTVVYRGQHRGGARVVEKISGFLRVGPHIVGKTLGFLRVGRRVAQKTLGFIGVGPRVVEKISGFPRFCSRVFKKNSGFIGFGAPATTGVVTGRGCSTMPRQRIQS
jgi:hypothetical protein